MHDIFTFCDIHGMYDLYKAIMNYCNEQDPEATIVFIGDACDRGADGYKIMKELLANPRVVYLKGNHEDLFVKAAYEIKDEFHPFGEITKERVSSFLNTCMGYDYRYHNIQLSLQNGGKSTLMDWILNGMSMKFVKDIDNLPLTFSTDTCDFCHAAGVYKTFKHVADCEYEAKSVDEYDKNSLLWSRSAFNFGWAANRTVVFGHTPVPYLLEDMDIEYDPTVDVQPLKYYGVLYRDEGMTGAKIDMDTGACFLGDAYVLNTLTMKAYGFEDTDIRSTKEIRAHDVKKIGCIQL